MNRVGETKLNNQNLNMKIIKYTNARNIDVKFDDGTIISNRQYIDFKKGEIKNYNFPSICGVGYLGLNNVQLGKLQQHYIIWKHMIDRCYNKERLKKQPTYIGCKVCEYWFNFQNFVNWYDNNYYTIENEKMCLDKDILRKGNKLYSPDTCIFVPQSINTLFTKRQNYRGECYIGVSNVSNRNGFQVNCNIGTGRSLYVGYSNTKAGAFRLYKAFKEKYIKEVADKYKYTHPQFPQKLYEAMYRYEVEIND